MVNLPRNIVIHHSAVSREDNPEQFDAIDEYHKSKGWGGFGYHYLIEADGTLKHGRSESTAGAHTKESFMNYFSLGICLTGNFDVEEPTEEQKLALFNLIKSSQKKYDIPDKRIKPHRHYAKKSCWGSLLPDDIMNYLNPAYNAPEWARAAVEWAIANKISNGERLNEQITRAEIITMLYRFSKVYRD